MVSCANSPIEQPENVNQVLQISEVGVINNVSKMKKDPNPDAPASTEPMEYASVGDRRYDRIPLQSSKLASILISSQAAELTGDTTEDVAHVTKLVEDLKSTSPRTVREATSEIRLLSKEIGNRILIARCGAISPLVDLLHSSDSKTQEYAVTSLLNLSINNHSNKIAIMNAKPIEPLIHVLKTGTPEAKENTAAALFNLSDKENKVKIGISGAITPLIGLLVSGTPRGKKDAANALFSLSTCNENRIGIVKSGAVKHLIELMDPATGMVDRAIVILANLATIQEGRSAIAQAGGIPHLVEAIEIGSSRGKENAAVALVHLCLNSTRYSKMVLEQGVLPPLVILTKSGTARAREKANKLLEHFRSKQRSYARRG